jgi:hypothetical protein
MANIIGAHTNIYTPSTFATGQSNDDPWNDIGKRNDSIAIYNKHINPRYDLLLLHTNRLFNQR